MNNWFENFSIWYCVTVLVSIGFFFGVFYANPGEQVLSVLANISTFLGFILASYFYLIWRRKEFLSSQNSLISSMLQELAVLDYKSDLLFSRLSLLYAKDFCNSKEHFPNKRERIILEEIMIVVDSLRQLMSKYYAIELSPQKVSQTMGATGLLHTDFEDEFSQLKDVLLRFSRLNYLTDSGHVIYFNDSELRSSKSAHQKYLVDQKHLFHGKSNFFDMSIEFSDQIKTAMLVLRKRVS
ncbi:hypothetical protein [Vibrio diabolicus]|uniref:hypothetical protein n=1 Tax=Vibrio diabolicus TaxID=50719 RepID=UPI00215F80F9|nr:hypothetical protein [Vibrio diabolicus]MCS0309222.1 hypothetical protein [Vibrio diabolicus]